MMGTMEQATIRQPSTLDDGGDEVTNVLVGADPLSEPIPGYVHDLGVGGAFIEMPEPLPPVGERVQLELLLSEKPHVVYCTGLVVWTSDDAPADIVPEKNGIAVQLVDVGPMEIEFIADVLR
ncbi:PilZ domain-containing protein [Myxococcota bacterium]